MPIFQYRAIDGAGKEVTGILNADSRANLFAAFKKEGIQPIKIEEVDSAKGKATKAKASLDIKALFQRINAQEIAIFTRQLATMVNAGIRVDRCLKILSEQTSIPKFKLILSQLKRDVDEGVSFSEALAKHANVFKPLYINMVNASYGTGKLGEALLSLADYLEEQVKLRNRIMGAMMYPMVMVGVGAVIMVILFAVVIPKLTGIFKDLDRALPILTEILISISHFMGSYKGGIALIFIIIGAMFFKKWTRGEVGRQHWHKFLLKMPIFGKLSLMINTGRFTRTLSTLLKSGVLLPRALDITKNIIDNVIIQKVIEDAKIIHLEGHDLAKALELSKMFPPMVTQMIATGEETGKLSDMLIHIAKSYEEQAETRVNSLTTLLEPLLIVFMGGIVAFIVFAIMLPIIEINKAAGGF